MPDYRRWHSPGATYFFTVVTQERRPILRNAAAVRLLGDVMRTVRAKRPFQTIAIVALWDHLHCVWSLRSGDHDFSGRWRWIKGAFTERWLAGGNSEFGPSAPRSRRGEHGVWQRRFWEHVIRDERDLEKHVDYIHYNPVKHGYVSSPADWPWSSFGRFLEVGHYPAGWGQSEPVEPFPSPRE